MSEHKQNNKNKEYIDELKEWQDHQYDPGYYTGGRIHPLFKKPGKPKAFGIFFIALSLLFAIPLAVNIVQTVSNKDTLTSENILFLAISVVLYAGIFIFLLMAGIQRIKESKTKRK